MSLVLPDWLTHKRVRHAKPDGRTDGGRCTGGSSMTFTPRPELRYEKRDRKAWLYLNRPDQMNALNTGLRLAINEAVHEAERDDDVLVLIVISESGCAFCAGTDQKKSLNNDFT